MKISIPQPQFLKTLQTVEHAVNERSTLPILSNILLQTTNQELILTATDLDVGIQCRFPLLQPGEPGAVALPARRLTSIVRELPEETITLEAKKNHAVTLTCGRSNFRVPGLPAEDFPVLPSHEAGEVLALPQAHLKQLIQSTAYAMSIEETRFILNGTLLRTQKHDLVLVATDGRRMAVASMPLATLPKTPVQLVIPAKTIRELGRLLQADALDEVTITLLQDNQLAFRFGAIAMMTRLIDGQFPEYDKVIPAPSKNTMTCNRLELANAIRRASLMTSANSQAVVFEVGKERVVISKESSELGSAHEELSVIYTGSPLQIAFNPTFWLEGLKALDTEDVVVELSGAERPAVIRQPHFTYVVLPMKIS